MNYADKIKNDFELAEKLDTELERLVKTYKPRFGDPSGLEIENLLGKLNKTKQLERRNSIKSSIIYLIKNR